MTTPEFLMWAVGVILVVFLAEGIIEMIGYIVFGIFTLGLVKLEGAEHQRIKFPWHGFARSKDNRLVVQAKVASLIGLLLLGLIGIVALFWRLHLS